MTCGGVGALYFGPTKQPVANIKPAVKAMYPDQARSASEFHIHSSRLAVHAGSIDPRVIHRSALAAPPMAGGICSAMADTAERLRDRPDSTVLPFVLGFAERCNRDEAGVSYTGRLNRTGLMGTRRPFPNSPVLGALWNAPYEQGRPAAHGSTRCCGSNHGGSVAWP